MELTRENVHNTIRDCLYTEEEIKATNGKAPEGTIMVEGIMNRFGMHPERLESHREDVKSMLSQLPDEFMRSKGDGWSFLNAAVRKDGTQWGEQPDMEILFCLGMGLNLVKYTLPREMWDTLPGGMPYYTVEL